MGDRRESEGRTGPTAAPSSCFSQVHAHIPLPFLRKKIDLFLERSLNPEIYFNYKALESTPDTEIAGMAATLSAHGRRVTIHGPFYDLSPGAIDPAFRALTVERLSTALTRATPFLPDSIVFHPGYDPLRFAEHRDVWLRNSLRTWKELLPLAGRIPSTWILIENIFERDPHTLAMLLEKLPSPPFGFCFDTGHFLVFSEVPLDEWLEVLEPHLREVHLHDNDGRRDQHLPPGRGRFDFGALFRRIASLPHPVIGTIEAHSEADLLEGLAFLKDHGAG
jgi:sugar phosphate isomerase/epimerase